MDGGIEQNPAYGTAQPTVSKMLGHSDPAMTLRRYAHVLEDMREDAARAMDELFSLVDQTDLRCRSHMAMSQRCRDIAL